MWFRKYLPWFFREMVTVFQNVTLCGWNVFTSTAENSAVYVYVCCICFQTTY